MDELPSYKPIVKMEKKGKDDKFRSLPYIENGRVYYEVVVDPDSKFSPHKEELWKQGLSDSSPEIWWVLNTTVGDHKNRAKLADYFPNLPVPDEVDDLYRCYWQLRLLLNKTSCGAAIKRAEDSWFWYSSDKNSSF